MIIIIFFIWAGIFNAVMDSLKIWNSTCWKYIEKNNWWYRWAGPQSWKNKWKYGKSVNGERFWGSSTIFVFITDGWHFFQMLWRSSVTAGTVMAMYYYYYFTSNILVDMLIWFVILTLAYLLPFNIFYKIFKNG